MVPPYSKVKVKLTTVVEDNPKTPFSLATTPRCRGGRYSFPWIAPFYPKPVYYYTDKQGGIKYHFLSFSSDSTLN